MPKLEVEQLRADFPILERTFDGQPLIYLDSAATSLKPRAVITALAEFYATSAGGVHRNVHRLGHEVTVRYQAARQAVALFLGAAVDEIVFVSNTTEAINLVAAGHPGLRGRPVVLTAANHHSGLLPWLQPGQEVRIARVGPDGIVDLADLERLLPGAALLCLPHVNNAFGLLFPVAEAIALAHQAGALVLLDGAQSVPHMPVDVGGLDCDFLAFSGHKMLAPWGIGGLYGKRDCLAAMTPVRWGGGMVEGVVHGQPILRQPPDGFEAGTPNVGGAVALAAAIDYLEALGLAAIHQHVSDLARLARQQLRAIPDLVIHGPLRDDLVVSAVSFSFPGMAAHALARILSNRFGIMVRSGFHCTQPLHEALALGETVRASFYLYNTAAEVAALVSALHTIRTTVL